MSEHLKLRDYQREAIDAVFAAWSEGTRRPAVVLPTGAGKGHPAHTEIPTPNGVRKWGDLRTGDLVFGSDGRPARILDVYDRGELPTYTVTFSDGSSVDVDGDHLWRVRDAKYRKTSREERTLSTTDVVNAGLRHGPSYRFRIPMTETVERPGTDLPIDPYALGALIANGSLAHSGTTLSTPDVEVVDRIRGVHTVNKIQDTTPGVCDRYSLPRISRVLEDFGLNVRSAGKHIPTAYLEAPVVDRIALLQGLMDCDGSSRSGGRRSVQYHTTSPRLAADAVELVTSLGGTASPRWVERTGVDRPQSRECTIHVLLPGHIEPFHSSRKKQTEKPRRAFMPRRAIVSVAPAGTQRITCIRVDAPDNLYLVTRHHIVTHNTVIFSHLASRFIDKQSGPLDMLKVNPGIGHRVVILVHRDELADQAINKVRQIAPHLSVGKVKAESNEIDADVMVCSVQTLAVPRRLRQVAEDGWEKGPVGLIVTDECHHGTSRTYRKIYGAFPDAVNVGFTATLARGDGTGLGDVWDDVVYTKSLLSFVSRRYLTPVRGVSVKVDGLDLKGVKKTGGDFQTGDLGRAIEDSGLPAALPKAYSEHAADRPGVVFTPTVATAHAAADALNAAGIRTAVISGETPREDRVRIYDDYRTGRVQVLSNCMVLTEGFDAPWASCAVIARPTQSNPLYIQMVGRVLRPWPGKQDALVLDMVGASRDNKLSTLVDLDPGLFPERKPCDECLRIPCVCPCQVCGQRKPCACPRETQELTLAGTGGAVDLFGASEQTWLRTPAGIMFVPAGEGEVLLWPSRQPGLWDTVYAPKTGSWERLHEGLEMGLAMAWAETEADERAGFNVRRKASWRRTKASEKQLAAARRMGIVVDESMKKGEVGDLISVEIASRRLDRFARRTK